MKNINRQEEIFEYIKSRQFASIAEIASYIYTSESTVRREVQRLHEEGLIKRVYGGVILAKYENEPIPIYLRDNENTAKKEIIAQNASRFIKDNSTIILDSSSTVRRICKHIKNINNLTVITNNLRVCQELKDSNIKVICTGGNLIPRRECFVGHFAEEFLSKIRADMVFFSSQGLSKNGDITDSSIAEVSIRKIMLKNSRDKYFLCDILKVNKDYPFILCNKKDVTKVICQ